MKKKETEKSADRHIRITDISLLEQIDEIMQYPEYNNFNKVICSALFYGLPALRKELCGSVYAGRRAARVMQTAHPTLEGSKSERDYQQVDALLDLQRLCR